MSRARPHPSGAHPKPPMSPLRLLLPALGLTAVALASQDPAPSPSPDRDAPAARPAIADEAPGAGRELADPTLAALVRHVDEARMQAEVRALVALGPRMGGTASGHAAADHLAAAFREAGLEVEVREDPEAWRHQEASWSLTYRILGPDGEAGEPVPLESAWPWGFSPAAAGSAPLGTDAVDGGAVLTDGRPRFLRRGPTPAVALTDGLVTLDGAYPRIYQQRSGDANPFPIFGLNTADGAALRAELAAGRAVELQYELLSTIERARPRTVIARVPARAGAAPGFLLYCAHGDSDAGGPGADDNASGTAVVLEMARAWAAALEAGAERPPRELRFAVWGSEIHSTRDWLAEQRAAEQDATGPPLLGVINYDQAGYGSGADQLNIEPDDLPANRVMIERILAVLAEAEGAAGFPTRWATNKSLGGTDSYVFSGSRHFRDEGRPALTLFTSAWDKPDEQPRTAGMAGESWSDRDVVNVDYDVYYHSAGDTPENTTDKEPWNMGWCARVGLVGGLAWLEQLEAEDAAEAAGEPPVAPDGD